jgi:UDP-glucose 4-epimerase
LNCKKFIITGGSGFIGRQLTLNLLSSGNSVKNIDKKSPKNIHKNLTKNELSNYSFVKLDLTKHDIKKHLKGYDVVIHLAANSNARLGYKKPQVDFNDGLISTFNVLEAMRKSNISEIIFSSSSTVYGNSPIIPTPENTSTIPISNYGAAKLASESFILSYSELYDIKCWIFRFGNVIGKDSSQGVVFDLIRKLQKNKNTLEVLGNGNQKKDYIYIDDCVEGILHAYYNTKKTKNIFNLGTATTISVKEIVKLILKKMSLSNTPINFMDKNKKLQGGGWPGDVPKIILDNTKMKNLGWIPRYNSKKSITLSIDDILNKKYS